MIPSTRLSANQRSGRCSTRTLYWDCGSRNASQRSVQTVTGHRLSSSKACEEYFIFFVETLQLIIDELQQALEQDQAASPQSCADLNFSPPLESLREKQDTPSSANSRLSYIIRNAEPDSDDSEAPSSTQTRRYEDDLSPLPMGSANKRRKVDAPVPPLQLGLLHQRLQPMSQDPQRSFHLHERVMSSIQSATSSGLSTAHMLLPSACHQAMSYSSSGTSDQSEKMCTWITTMGNTIRLKVKKLGDSLASCKDQIKNLAENNDLMAAKYLNALAEVETLEAECHKLNAILHNTTHTSSTLYDAIIRASSTSSSSDGFDTSEQVIYSGASSPIRPRHRSQPSLPPYRAREHRRAMSVEVHEECNFVPVQSKPRHKRCVSATHSISFETEKQAHLTLIPRKHKRGISELQALTLVSTTESLTEIPSRVPSQFSSQFSSQLPSRSPSEQVVQAHELRAFLSRSWGTLSSWVHHPFRRSRTALEPSPCSSKRHRLMRHNSWRLFDSCLGAHQR